MTPWTKILVHLHITPTAAGQPWRPNRVISQCTAFVLMLMPEEFRSSAVIESGEDWRVLRTTCLSTRQLHCVTLLGLTLCGWLAVVTKHFHFARVSLTVYGGMSRREDIFSADLLGILSQSPCHRSCAWFYTTVAMKLKKTQIQRLRSVECFCRSLGTMKTPQKVHKLWFL